MAADEPNLDIKAIVGVPGWFRLRIGEHRICYYRAALPDGSTIYAVERIVPRGAFAAAAGSLPDHP